ncbi:MAG: type IV secretory system conjugative DNA transfer family protein [Pseudomonadota bacterium]
MTSPGLVFNALIGILALVAVSIVASLIFFTWEGFDVDYMRPWSVYTYLFEYWEIERVRNRALISLTAPIVLAVIMFAMGPIYKPKAVFGDAHFANHREMMNAGLFKQRGVLLGRAHGKYICSDANTHTLLIGPPRAGKGTGVVVPNCLNWHGSLVVLDLKGENHRVTSGFRAQHGSKVYYWAPMSKKSRSFRYNPLDQISPNPIHQITDVQTIASMLIDVSDKDPMWGQEARSLFTGAALYVLQNRETKTLGEVYRFVTSTADLPALCQKILDNTQGLTTEVISSLGSFAGKAPKEAAGVRSTMQASLRLFENPVVDAATSASDFRIEDLRRKQMSIYVGVTTAQLETAAPLLRLFFQQVMSIMSDTEPGPGEPHEVLMVMDEFASLGAMNSIVSAFTLLASYNVRILAVLQGLSWLDRIYGKDTREGLIACCGHQIIMTTNDETTSNYASQALGERTVTNDSVTRRAFSFEKYYPSKNTSAIARPLMTKDQVRKLDKKKQILLTEGHVPALVKKIVYYKDRLFKKRLAPPAPVPPLDLSNYNKPLAPFGTANPGDAAEGSLDPNTTPQSASGTASSAHQDAPDSDTSSLDAAQGQFFELLRHEMATNPALAELSDEVAALESVSLSELD